MITRLARETDIPRIAAVSRAYYDEIAFGPLVGIFEEEHAADMLAACNGPDSVLIVTQAHGKIIGVIYAIILRTTFYQRKIAVAQEIILHTDPELSPFRRIKIMSELVALADKHLREKGAILSAMGTRLKAGATGRLLEKQGYTATGLQWHKEL